MLLWIPACAGMNGKKVAACRREKDGGHCPLDSCLRGRVAMIRSGCEAGAGWQRCRGRGVTALGGRMAIRPYGDARVHGSGRARDAVPVQVTMICAALDSCLRRNARKEGDRLQEREGRWSLFHRVPACAGMNGKKVTAAGKEKDGSHCFAGFLPARAGTQSEPFSPCVSCRWPRCLPRHAAPCPCSFLRRNVS